MIIDRVPSFSTTDGTFPVQPYNGGTGPDDLNRTLGILNDWARIDRHRRLSVVRSLAYGAQPGMGLPESVSLTKLVFRNHGFLEFESEVVRFELCGYVQGMEVQLQPDLLIEIAVN